jgi:hypothetical protein
MSLHSIVRTYVRARPCCRKMIALCAPLQRNQRMSRADNGFQMPPASLQLSTYLPAQQHKQTTTESVHSQNKVYRIRHHTGKANNVARLSTDMQCNADRASLHTDDGGTAHTGSLPRGARSSTDKPPRSSLYAGTSREPAGQESHVTWPVPSSNFLDYRIAALRTRSICFRN